jgi:RNA polymerase sigma factor (sigma-70 family)
MSIPYQILLDKKYILQIITKRGQQLNREKILVDKILAGDTMSWQTFVIKYSNYIYKAIVKYIDDYDEKMNVYLEVLEKLKKNQFEKLKNFRFRSRLSTWLTVVTRNITIDYLRSTYGRDFRLKQITTLSYDTHQHIMNKLSDQKNPETEMIQKKSELSRAEFLGQLEKIIRDLDPKESLLIKLVYFKGIKIKDAGDMLNIPSVYKSLSRIIKKIRNRVQHTTSIPGATLESFIREGDLR